jgi:hypothetical protein
MDSGDVNISSFFETVMVLATSFLPESLKVDGVQGSED